MCFQGVPRLCLSPGEGMSQKKTPKNRKQNPKSPTKTILFPLSERLENTCLGGRHRERRRGILAKEPKKTVAYL